MDDLNLGCVVGRLDHMLSSSIVIPLGALLWSVGHLLCNECISLSTALREVIVVMKLLQELKDNKIIKKSYIPKIHCKAFEDNSGALEMARTPKMRPRTKFMNVKHHHFRSHAPSALLLSCALLEHT